jgi:hypothetical protein
MIRGRALKPETRARLARARIAERAERTAGHLAMVREAAASGRCWADAEALAHAEHVAAEAALAEQGALLADRAKA